MNKRPPTQLVIRRPRRLPSISSAIAGLAIAGMTLAACSSAAGAVKPPTAQHSADFAKNHRVPADARAVAPAIVDETSDSLRQEHLGIDPSAARTPVAAASGASRKGQLRRTAPKAASTSTTFVNETADSLRKEHLIAGR
jgi:hypothetical protein